MNSTASSSERSCPSFCGPAEFMVRVAPLSCEPYRFGSESIFFCPFVNRGGRPATNPFQVQPLANPFSFVTSCLHVPCGKMACPETFFTIRDASQEVCVGRDATHF